MTQYVCFRTSSQAGGILTSQLKATNGVVGGAGLELTTPPLSGAGQLSSQDIQGLFINQHVGYAQPGASGTQNLQIVKREPEDLSHHRKLDSGSPGSGSLDGSIIVKQPRHKVIYFVRCECVVVYGGVDKHVYNDISILWPL